MTILGSESFHHSNKYCVFRSQLLKFVQLFFYPFLTTERKRGRVQNVAFIFKNPSSFSLFSNYHSYRPYVGFKQLCFMQARGQRVLFSSNLTFAKTSVVYPTLVSRLLYISSCCTKGRKKVVKNSIYF